MWQDYVLSAIQIFFCFTLIPMLLAREKPPLTSSISTGIALLASAGVLATLGLWFTTAVQAIVGLEWLTLALQKFLQLRETSRD